MTFDYDNHVILFELLESGIIEMRRGLKEYNSLLVQRYVLAKFHGIT